jgi:hypothetical protein
MPFVTEVRVYVYVYIWRDVMCVGAMFHQSTPSLSLSLTHTLIHMHSGELGAAFQNDGTGYDAAADDRVDHTLPRSRTLPLHAGTNSRASARGRRAAVTRVGGREQQHS